MNHLDFYCERTGIEFWSEPLNAISNIGFIIAGAWALRKVLRYKQNAVLITLSLLLMGIGVGSFLFHTVADSVTLWCDMIPIFIFVSCYIFHSLKRYLGYSSFTAVAALVICVGGMLTAELTVPNTFINGSSLYIPPLTCLITIGLLMRNTSESQNLKTAAHQYLLAAGVFLISLVFRTVDPIICSAIPVGTHFVWHTLNSLCLAILMSIAIEFENNPTKTLRQHHTNSDGRS